MELYDFPGLFFTVKIFPCTWKAPDYLISISLFYLVGFTMFQAPNPDSFVTYRSILQ